MDSIIYRQFRIAERRIEMYFEIKQSNNEQYYFVIKGSNHEVVATSETYMTLQSTENTIKSIQSSLNKDSAVKYIKRGK